MNEFRPTLFLLSMIMLFGVKVWATDKVCLLNNERFEQKAPTRKPPLISSGAYVGENLIDACRKKSNYVPLEDVPQMLAKSYFYTINRDKEGKIIEVVAKEIYKNPKGIMFQHSNEKISLIKIHLR